MGNFDWEILVYAPLDQREEKRSYRNSCAERTGSYIYFRVNSHCVHRLLESTSRIWTWGAMNFLVVAENREEEEKGREVMYPS
jgi:hypothetical protein